MYEHPAYDPNNDIDYSQEDNYYDYSCEACNNIPDFPEVCHNHETHQEQYQISENQENENFLHSA